MIILAFMFGVYFGGVITAHIWMTEYEGLDVGEAMALAVLWPKTIYVIALRYWHGDDSDGDYGSA